jgi:hypothetical protein
MSNLKAVNTIDENRQIEITQMSSANRNKSNIQKEDYQRNEIS